MNMKNNRKGFTTVELVIVIAVIAILATVLIPTFSNLINQANLSTDKQNVRNMNMVLMTYMIEGTEDFGDVRNQLLDGGYKTGETFAPKTANHKYYWYVDRYDRNGDGKEEDISVILLVDETNPDVPQVVYPEDYTDVVPEKLKDIRMCFDLALPAVLIAKDKNVDVAGGDLYHTLFYIGNREQGLESIFDHFDTYRAATTDARPSIKNMLIAQIEDVIRPLSSESADIMNAAMEYIDEYAAKMQNVEANSDAAKTIQKEIVAKVAKKQLAATYTFTISDEESAQYEDYIASFYLKAKLPNGMDSVKIELGGYYSLWNEAQLHGMWKIQTSTIGDNQEINLLEKLGWDTTLTYNDIRTKVQEFQCGVVDAVGEIDQGVELTVELRLTETSEERGPNGELVPKTDGEEVVLGIFTYTYK